jgi:hypothetical protein
MLRFISRRYESNDSKSGSRKEGAADERRFENGVVQKVVMAGITDGMEEPITHQHQRAATIRIQKAINGFIKWAEDTGLKVLTQKTKAIMFSRTKFPITTIPRMNIWAKGEKIKQVRQHRILGLTLDTRMNWLEHNKNTKTRAEKIINIIKCLAHTTWGPDQSSLLKVHQMIVLGKLRYVEESYGSATETVLKKLETTHNKGIRFALGALAVSRTENVLCEAGMTTLTEMKKLSNTKATIQIVTKKEHLIRHFCTNPSKFDEYALRPKTPKPLYIRVAEHLRYEDPTINVSGRKQTGY